MGRRGRRSNRNQFLAGLDETFCGFGELQTKERDPRREHEIEPRGNQRLVLAINFAQAPFGAVAMHGIAHRRPRGNHTHARISRRTRRSNPPSEKKDAAIDAAALLSDSAEVGVAPQALTGGQSHVWARGVRHAKF